MRECKSEERKFQNEMTLANRAGRLLLLTRRMWAWDKPMKSARRYCIIFAYIIKLVIIALETSAIRDQADYIFLNV